MNRAFWLHHQKMNFLTFVLLCACSKEFLCETVHENEEVASKDVETAENGDMNDDSKVVSVLEEILQKVILLQQEKSKDDGSSCISALGTPRPDGSPYFTPKLKEFHSWMLSSNISTNRLNAALLEFVTDEHARIVDDMRRHENRMTSTNLEESKANLLTLKALGRNLTTEMLAFTSQVRAFEENLQNTLRKVGCSGSTISIVDGKFCRNQKWFYPVGAYVGGADDFSSNSFRLTRLKLFGQMWNLKSAGGNLAIFRIKNLPTRITSENLKQLTDIAESIELLVLLEVGKISLDELTDLLEFIKDSPALVGVTVQGGSDDYLENIRNIETIRSSYPLLMFSVTFTCRKAYLSSTTCQQDCYNHDGDIENCLRYCGSSYNRQLNRHYSEVGTSCNNYPNLSMKSKIEGTLDFVIANDFDSTTAIPSLKAIVNLPTVFQGLRKAPSLGMSDASGFFVDAEVTDKSRALKTLQSLRETVRKSAYEGLTSA